MNAPPTASNSSFGDFVRVNACRAWHDGDSFAGCRTTDVEVQDATDVADGATRRHSEVSVGFYTLTHGTTMSVANANGDTTHIKSPHAAAAAAGLALALWVLLVVQPLNTRFLEATNANDAESAAQRLRASAISGALFAALFAFCETFVGSCSVTGFDSGSRSAERTSRREQANAVFGKTLCNMAGAIFGASTAAAVLHVVAAAAGSVVAADMMCAAVAAARTAADDHPSWVFWKSVVAGFLLCEAMACSTRDAVFRFVPVFSAVVLIITFNLRLGLVDITFTSATAALNALQPQWTLLGPNVLNSLVAIAGNLVGSAWARAASELVSLERPPVRYTATTIAV